MEITTTKYYDEFIRYFNLALDQQKKSNLGHIPHQDSDMNDPLMEQIELYDVVERKFAGFSQIVNDVFYGWTEDHPYWSRMEKGLVTSQRLEVAKNWTGKQDVFGLEESPIQAVYFTDVAVFGRKVVARAVTDAVFC